MKTDKFVRMRLSTWNKLRQIYPGLKGESAADYFKRVANRLELIEAEWTKF